jgi:hypothetical protein
MKVSVWQTNRQELREILIFFYIQADPNVAPAERHEPKFGSRFFELKGVKIERTNEDVKDR